MTKKVLCVVLVLCMLLSMTAPVFAAGENRIIELDTYLMETGSCNKIEYLVPGNESCVYIRADELLGILNESHVFKYKLSHSQCAFVHEQSGFVVMFDFNSKDVTVGYCGYTAKYTAPSKTIFVDDVCWVPLHFALELFGGTAMISEERIVVELPKLNALVSVSEAYTHRKDLSFSWIKDVGYSEKNLKKMIAYGGMANFLDDLIGFEASSWGVVLSLGLVDSYSVQYSEEIAQMFVGPSLVEVPGEVSDISMSSAADAVTSMQTINGGIEGTAEISKTFRNGEVEKGLADLGETLGLQNSDQWKKIQTAAKKYGSKLEGDQGLFKKAKVDEILEKADKNGDLSDKLSIAVWLVNLVEFYCRFCEKSDYAMSALKTYAAESKEEGARYFKTFSQADEDSTATLLLTYFAGNLDTLVYDLMSWKTLMGSASAILLVWDLASAMIPWISDGLANIETFELTNCSQQYQDESGKFMNRYAAKAFANKKINEAYLDELTKNTYAFLKFSLICHNSAETFIDNSDIPSDAKSDITKRLKKSQRELGCLINKVEIGGNGLLPSQCSSRMCKTQDKTMIQLLNEKGTVTGTLELLIEPILDTTNAITEKEARELCKKVYAEGFLKVWGGPGARMKGEYWNDYTYEVVDMYHYEDKNIGVYVISENDSEEIFFVVPFDGSEVWPAAPKGDEYFVYDQLNLLEFSVKDIIATVGDLGLTLFEFFGELAKEEKTQ